MKVLISGSTGFVGSALTYFLKRKGHQVIRLVRRYHPDCEERQIAWDIPNARLRTADLEGVDAVVHLAGENIAGFWTEERKKRILNSRVQGTQLLADTLARMNKPPKVFISASAVGYYGNQYDAKLTEVSDNGSGFLASVCRQWEAATRPAAEKGIRVVNTRFGVILHPEGGLLKLISWPFRLGLAGKLGAGRQYLSWVALEDVLNAIEFILAHDGLRGPVNVTSPNPVTNAEFSDAMRKALNPAWLPTHYWTLPAPAFALKLLLGEMAEEMLLSSVRAYPIRLREAGYQFHFTEIEETLKALL
jgi:uncharacterized protein (TIGR01777 family)